jgi:hypothetical protein
VVLTFNLAQARQPKQFVFCEKTERVAYLLRSKVGPAAGFHSRTQRRAEPSPDTLCPQAAAVQFEEITDSLPNGAACGPVHDRLELNPAFAQTEELRDQVTQA